MSAPAPDGPEEARRRALEILGALLADAKAGRTSDGAWTGAADFRKALGELRGLDPEVQRRVARAMVETRGDPAALRAAIETAPTDRAGHRVAPRPTATPRPPTVVDARSGTPWPVVVIAAIAAAIAAALLAGAGQ